MMNTSLVLLRGINVRGEKYHEPISRIIGTACRTMTIRSWQTTSAARLARKAATTSALMEPM
jgi:hypothetical protein